jgi:hypothetical protein
MAVLPVHMPHQASANAYTSYADGTDVGFFSVTSAYPRPSSAHTVCLACTSGDIGRYTTFPLTMYGQVRTYIAMGQSGSFTCIAQQANGTFQRQGSASWALRFD